ncbi:MAG: hypothetical protein NTV70_11245 [Acidobacteria bacterium]|nr:hypothetical protein [Acidobacteriota bacterium]
MGFTEHLFHDGDEVISDIELVKIYFLTHGRNAWHSTWISRYWKGCMHVTWEKARDHAEEVRKQGAVFYIKELPALAIAVDDMTSIVISQINALDVLSGYSPVLADDSGGADKSVLEPGTRMIDTYLSFSFGSLFWKTPPLASSVIRLQYWRYGGELEPLTESLNMWTSSSRGPAYYLDWHSTPGNISASTLRSLLAANQAVRSKRKGA